MVARPVVVQVRPSQQQAPVQHQASSGVSTPATVPAPGHTQVVRTVIPIGSKSTGQAQVGAPAINGVVKPIPQLPLQVAAKQLQQAPQQQQQQQQ
eukprot:CAMPEP_0206494230 /NCGR_PEP_ID=MMETSP0324_2-20121206/47581_1 /ASSEMBLY_ACC=CAM_ASM_000836 /TAXON_ID=2866 /ORGANISM="Crypthecodinium cohnii, Strain Seligo" /LENGTH=94 /DNA_ID=CAMNT_0053977799 /DNA_START=229 /DNA_END=510 /DNA_ORIENTATION=-